MAKQWINLAKGPRGWPMARTLLDGREYVLEAVWNANEFVWSVSISQADGTLLRPGLWARHRVDILAPFSGLEFPGDGLGQIRAWDTSRGDADPGRDDLGRDDPVRLAYIPRADVLAEGG